MFVKDEFGRCYNVIDGVMYTLRNMNYEEARNKLNITISEKSWDEICGAWKRENNK
ncbi:hypothetical protein [Anaerophilus nitritogenes]|uniref:hypothetical protein n=1 Tax=Anaerophilus nitritogenes TaxID=2498136 RepID=UPI0013ED2D21|nr:hypothetical protein [Anaerophilus nitritogenes]